MMRKLLSILLAVGSSIALQAQDDQQWQQKFEQLGTMLPTPNSYRTGAGAPGENYWQQKADYKIDVELDDTKQTITGSETITYTNNSPHTLGYLWVQLDQNVREKGSDRSITSTSAMQDSIPAKFVSNPVSDYDGGFKITSVKDANGKALPFTINKTMMRVDLPSKLSTGGGISMIVWNMVVVADMNTSRKMIITPILLHSGTQEWLYTMM